MRPSQPDPRSVRALERRIDQEAQQLAKACRRLSRQRFACEADARSAAEHFVAEQAPLFHTPHVQLVAHTHTHRPRGRPRRDGAGVAGETVWHLAAQVQEPTAEQRQAWTEAQAYFVLLTNVPRDELPAAEVLREYKGQVLVERCFSFLKDPVIVDGIYLKRPERAYALGFVFLLALLVAVEVFPGHVGDPETLPAQIARIPPTLASSTSSSSGTGGWWSRPGWATCRRWALGG